MSPLTSTIDHAATSAFLRRALLADAVMSGAAGLLMAFGAGLLGELLGLPVALLQGAGLILIPYAAFVAFVGTRQTPASPAVWTIMACNVVWAAASVALLLTGWVAPTALGIAFVIAQAAAVGLFAELQFVGLRKAGA